MNTIELPAVMESLDESLDFIIEGVERAGIDRKTAYQIRLACEEAIVNVIHYAYPDGQGSVTIEYEMDTDLGELVIIISDGGIPFNPLEKDDPDIGLPLEERQIGGLGIFMVRKIMDTVEYVRENGQNRLMLKKSLNGQ